MSDHFTGTCSRHGSVVAGDDACPDCEREALVDAIASRLAPVIHLPPVPASKDYDINADYVGALDLGGELMAKRSGSIAR